MESKKKLGKGMGVAKAWRKVSGFLTIFSRKVRGKIV